MKENKEYNILFKGLKLGNHLFEYKISKKFFDSYNYDEYNDVDILVNLDLIKKETILELYFKIKGTVNVLCDLSGEPFNQPINGELNIIVRFGDEYNDDDDVILILPHHEYSINVAHYIYETIILSVPSKRIHPKVKDGSIKVALNNNKEIKENKTDPRWDKLKKLLK